MKTNVKPKEKTDERHEEAHEVVQKLMAACERALGQTKLDPKAMDMLIDALRFARKSQAVEIQDAQGTQPESLDTRQYRLAPSGEGPLAFEWKDKPHRLLYNLCTALETERVERSRERALYLEKQADLENELTQWRTGGR